MRTAGGEDAAPELSDIYFEQAVPALRQLISPRVHQDHGVVAAKSGDVVRHRCGRDDVGFGAVSQYPEQFVRFLAGAVDDQYPRRAEYAHEGVDPVVAPQSVFGTDDLGGVRDDARRLGGVLEHEAVRARRQPDGLFGSQRGVAVEPQHGFAADGALDGHGDGEAFAVVYRLGSADVGQLDLGARVHRFADYRVGADASAEQHIGRLAHLTYVLFAVGDEDYPPVRVRRHHGRRTEQRAVDIRVVARRRRLESVE